ncbi:MAG: ammonium transporter [Rhizobiales bacterium]|nr:ammonium transporter [Hyphomicrobiales bacterium]
MIDSGDTAWILTSTALVLLMTMPGLALFYAGLVRSRNILSVLMHCSAICCGASLLWFICAYSLAFADGTGLVGSLDKAFLSGVERDAVFPGTAIPESVFFSFQMTFAIITPALIVGAYVERIKFGAVLLFSALWLLVVYAPVAHWVWGGGWLADLGVKDFAGGIVVHVTAGVSALVIAAILGSRSGFPEQTEPPHAPWMVMVGAAMLWVGWFGFNAGSALAAGADAGMALLVTHLSAATASLVWLVIEWARFGKPSLVGLVTGTIAGLATVTPASGFIGPIGGVILGLAGGVICYLAVDIVKRSFRVDDSLDVLAVHGVGGATGTLLTAVLIVPALSGVGLDEGVSMGDQFVAQLIGVAAALVWSAVATFVIVKLTQALVGLRVNEEEEVEGLDYTAHGETGYRL